MWHGYSSRIHSLLGHQRHNETWINAHTTDENLSTMLKRARERKIIDIVLMRKEIWSSEKWYICNDYPRYLPISGNNQSRHGIDSCQTHPSYRPIPYVINATSPITKVSFVDVYQFRVKKGHHAITIPDPLNPKQAGWVVSKYQRDTE